MTPPPMTPPPARSMTPVEWAMLVGLSVLWGGSFFFTRVALDALPPFTLVALRVGGAAILLLLALPLLGARMPREPRIWAAFAVMGFVNNAVPFSLIVWSQTHIASGLAAILNATTPLFVTVAAHLLTPDEKMTPNRVAGVLVGFAGVVVIMGGVGPGGGDVPAQLASLGAAAAYALGGIYGRRFRTLGVAPVATAAGQVTASSLMLLPVALLVDRPWTLPMPGLAAWGAVAGIAALSTALAFVIYFRILATAGATNILLVTFLVPVSAIVLGTLVLGEELRAHHLAGMVLIGCGLAAIDGRLLRAVSGRARAPRP